MKYYLPLNRLIEALFLYCLALSLNSVSVANGRMGVCVHKMVFLQAQIKTNTLRTAACIMYVLCVYARFVRYTQICKKKEPLLLTQSVYIYPPPLDPVVEIFL